MKTLALTLIALLVAGAAFAQLPTANITTPPGGNVVAAQELRPTDEVQRLKAENLSMKQVLLQQQVQELQRQVQEAGQKLEANWQALEAEMRTTLKVPADYTFDRQKVVFTAPALPGAAKEPR